VPLFFHESRLDRREDAPDIRSSSIEASSMSRACLLSVLSILTAVVLNVSRLGAAELQPLEIASKGGVHTFAVELALTPEQQAQGLMYRKELPEGHGMLFDFRREQELRQCGGVDRSVARRALSRSAIVHLPRRLRDDGNRR
jgi:hypothetical protein